LTATQCLDKTGVCGASIWTAHRPERNVALPVALKRPGRATAAANGTTTERTAMPILEGRVETERPSRYLVQFCKHAAAMGGGGHSARLHLHGAMARRDVQVQAEWSDTHGTVTFTPWGQCTLTVDPDRLTLRIEASDEDGMRQIQDVITRDLDRFSQRNPLAVTWQHIETPDAAHQRQHGDATQGRRRDTASNRVRANLQTIAIAVAVLLVISLHLGLAGAIVADSRWTGLATNAVVAIVVLKVAFIALALRRRRNHQRSGEM